MNPTLPPPEPRLRVPVALPVAGSTGEYELTRGDLAVLDRFKKRTVLTVGNSATRILYSQGAIELSLSVSFLNGMLILVSLLLISSHCIFVLTHLLTHSLTHPHR